MRTTLPIPDAPARPTGRSRLGLATLLAATLAGAAILGCADREPAVPARASGSVPQAARGAPAPRALPDWATEHLSAAWARFPAAVKAVWTQCLADGTIGVAGTPYAPGVNCRLFLVDGFPRRAVFYVPSAYRPQSTRKWPVVLLSHGSGGSGELFLGTSGWREQGEESGIVVGFGTGQEYRMLEDGSTQTKWNDFNLITQIDTSWRAPGSPASGTLPVDDLHFTTAILDDLQARLPVDEHRLYASGHSNGMSYTSRLAVSLSDRLAAVGGTAGTLDSAHPVRTPIPVELIIGNLDELVKARINATLGPGQTALGPDDPIPLAPEAFLAYRPLARIHDAWTSTLGLDSDRYHVVQNAHSTRMTYSTTLAGSRTGNVFVFALLDGVTHQYPVGARPRLQANNPWGFDAARELWRFFMAHPKP
jgi:poly(3-hydroxybutyrate) depolymerase